MRHVHPSKPVLYHGPVEIWFHGGTGATLLCAATKPEFDLVGQNKCLTIIYCAFIRANDINYVDKNQQKTTNPRTF